MRSESKFNIFDAAMGLLAAVILESVTTLIWLQITHSKLSTINGPLSVGQEISGFIGLWLGFIGSPYLESRIRGSKNFIRDIGLSVKWQYDVVVGLIAGVACQFILVNALYFPFELISKTLKHSLSQPAQNLTAASGATGFYFEIFLVVVIAPIAEEIFFRGFLLRALMDSLKNRTKYYAGISIVVSGLTFGLVHGELLQFPALALFGMVLAFIAFRTNRIGTTIFAHMGFNAVAAVMLIRAR